MLLGRFGHSRAGGYVVTDLHGSSKCAFWYGILTERSFVDYANHGSVNAEFVSPRVQEVRPELVLEPENGALQVCLLSSVACLWMSD